MNAIARILLLTSMFFGAASAEEGEIDEYLVGAEPSTTILFPWFTEAVGVFVFFILTRHFQALPYTAVMFVIGMAMGMGAERTLHDDKLTTSILQWTQIDSEVLLIVFLPGLTFPDAFDLNVNLFLRAFWQIFNLAFLIVLAGTVLTAVVAYYLFGYGWSFNLCMTFGAILGATDVAAVSALMSSLGAPPRLQMHIGGESMLNDGSSFVFYTIFSMMYLTELGIAGLGETVNLGQGIAIFFREGFGAAAYGIAFGLGLTFFLYKLNRKLDDSENVVQIVATVTVAYLAYYTADISGCSGVISVVATGITAKAYGKSMLNDPKVMEQFWGIVEQLLNSLLFALAGVVWGAIIGGSSEEGVFLAKDWGLLIMNYVLLNVIRFFLLFSFFPLNSRIGLGTDWQETFFSSFAGLRGAVGMSLALSLFNKVFEATADADGTDNALYQKQVTQLFGQVGGIVLLTLVVNGTVSGPLLKKLGLAKSPDSRVRLMKQMDKHFSKYRIDEFVRLLADPRFEGVELPIIQLHIPYLKNITLDELKAACLRHPTYTPNLQGILPYLSTDGQDVSWANTDPSETHRPAFFSRTADAGPVEKDANEDIIELRHFFLELLSTIYNGQLEDGELDGRNGFVAYSLLQSIDFASSDVDKGKSLDDWKAAQVVDKFFINTWTKFGSNAFQSIANKKYCCVKYSKNRVGDDRAHSLEYKLLKIKVLRAISFLEAHRRARNLFTEQLSDSSVVDANEQTVLDESNAESNEAQKELDGVDSNDLLIIKSHYFCSVLLNKMAKYAETLLDKGILEQKEATAYLNKADTLLLSVNNCSLMDHGSDGASKHVDMDTPEENADEMKQPSEAPETSAEEDGNIETNLSSFEEPDKSYRA